MLVKDIYRISAYGALVEKSNETDLGDNITIQHDYVIDNIWGWSPHNQMIESRGDAVTIYATLLENNSIKRKYVFQKTQLNDFGRKEYINENDPNSHHLFFKEVSNIYLFSHKPVDIKTRIKVKEKAKNI